MSEGCILIVEDEPIIRFAVGDYLRTVGHTVHEADTIAAGLKAFREVRPGVVLLDNHLPDGVGVDLLPELVAIDPEVGIIVLTGYGSIDLAVRAMSAGASNFVVKPVDLAALKQMIDAVIRQQEANKLKIVDTARRERDAVDPFLGISRAMRELSLYARRVVSSPSPKLVLGETGVGKGVLARWLHAKGPLAGGPFIDLNCAGLSREFLESELFGHERGAFTGAVAAKPGLLEVANRGTLFLDEVAETEPAVQAKILKVIEERRFRRLGETHDREVRVNLVAATHHDLRELVAAGRFREDLYFRLSTIPLHVPPLRERTDDIPLLVDSLLARIAREVGAPVPRLDPETVTALQSYAWPGNVRELRNVLERAVLLSDGVVRPSHLRFDPTPGRTSGTMRAAGSSSPVTLEALERSHIEAVLSTHSIADAAKVLGISRSSLYQRIKRFGLAVES